MTPSTVVRNLEIIGEAARYLPEDVRAGTPEIEWKKVVGLRNILSHRYFGVNTAIVWEVALKKVPLLEATCKRLLDE